jgi:hypothetical protein
MITPDQVVHLAHFTLSILAIWLGYWFLFRPYQVDRFRFDLLALRLKAEQLAAKPDDLAHPGVQSLVRRINSIRRFAARGFGPVHMALVLVLSRIGPPATQDTDSPGESQAAEVPAYLRGVEDCLVGLTFRFFLLRYPVGTIVLLLAAMYYAASVRRKEPQLAAAKSRFFRFVVLTGWLPTQSPARDRRPMATCP